jgi:hypothetical protein
MTLAAAQKQKEGGATNQEKRKRKKKAGYMRDSATNRHRGSARCINSRYSMPSSLTRITIPTSPTISESTSIIASKCGRSAARGSWNRNGGRQPERLAMIAVITVTAATMRRGVMVS